MAASRLFFGKVIIRAGKIWLECPKPESENGKVFFEKGLFQQLLKRVELFVGKNYKITQKDEVVRIVLSDIPDIDAAKDALLDMADLSSNIEHTHVNPL